MHKCSEDFIKIFYIQYRTLEILIKIKLYNLKAILNCIFFFRLQSPIFRVHVERIEAEADAVGPGFRLSRQKPETGHSRAQRTRGGMLKSYCGNRCWVFKNQTYDQRVGRPKAIFFGGRNIQKSKQLAAISETLKRTQHAHSHSYKKDEKGGSLNRYLLTSRTTPSRAGCEMFFRFV